MTEQPEPDEQGQGDKQETPSIADILSDGGFDTRRVLEDWVRTSDLTEDADTDDTTKG